MNTSLLRARMPRFDFARLFAFAFLSLSVALPKAHSDETALDRYIAKPDPAYAWKLASTIPGDGVKTFVIELTSQQWRTEADVDRPVWKHWLTLVKPDQAKPGIGFLFIGGGSNKDDAPKSASERTLELAKSTNTVVAELGMVPNQPLAFTDSKDKGRYEDDLIAYTRIKYMETKDETWLVRLAMVKSAVRALDCMTEFLASDDGGKLKVDRFVVAGGSKRGWTTWLTAVVDPRVIAIAPMVIDALNSEEITKHHFMAYGFFSSALNDYVNHGIFPGKIGNPDYQAVLKIEDPYYYQSRERLKSIPKFMINAAGDEFFLPDNSQFYWDKIQGEKHIRYVPNAKHSLAGSDAKESLQAFYQSVLDGKPRPNFTWRIREKDGAIVVKTDVTPKEVNLWQANNPNARDFRLDKIGKAYTSTPLKSKKGGTYVGRIKPAEKGYTAFFVELVFDSGGKYPFKFTTQVKVMPDVLPFKWEDAFKPNPGEK